MYMSLSAVEERYRSLWDELAGLGVFNEHPVKVDRAAVASIHEESRRFVEETRFEAPGALQIHGIASRLLGKWAEAEKSFRKFTELLPDRTDGWLELTWALGELNRLEDAEQSARVAVEMEPDGAETLGNLAAVLLQRGKIAKAYEVMQRALKADPKNVRNRMNMDVIESKHPWAIPWWNRLFGH